MMNQQERDKFLDAIIEKITEASNAKGIRAQLKKMSEVGDVIEEIHQLGYQQGLSERRSFIENKQLN